MTLDVARQAGNVEQATSTSGFADAVIENLGQQPTVRYPTKSRAARDGAGAAGPLGTAPAWTRPTRNCSASTSTPRWTATRSPWAGCSTRLPAPSSSCC